MTVEKIVVCEDTTLHFHNPSVRDFLLAKLDQEPTRLEQLVLGSMFFEQVELLRRYGLTEEHPWTGEGPHHGIRAWFDSNAQPVLERLMDVFTSPFGEYVATSDRYGRSDLRPRGSLAKRLAIVISLAEEAARTGTDSSDDRPRLGCVTAGPSQRARPSHAQATHGARSDRSVRG